MIIELKRNIDGKLKYVYQSSRSKLDWVVVDVDSEKLRTFSKESLTDLDYFTDTNGKPYPVTQKDIREYLLRPSKLQLFINKFCKYDANKVAMLKNLSITIELNKGSLLIGFFVIVKEGFLHSYFGAVYNCDENTDKHNSYFEHTIIGYVRMDSYIPWLEYLKSIPTDQSGYISEKLGFMKDYKELIAKIKRNWELYE